MPIVHSKPVAKLNKVNLSSPKPVVFQSSLCSTQSQISGDRGIFNVPMNRGQAGLSNSRKLECSTSVTNSKTIKSVNKKTFNPLATNIKYSAPKKKKSLVKPTTYVNVKHFSALKSLKSDSTMFKRSSDPYNGSFRNSNYFSTELTFILYLFEL